MATKRNLSQMESIVSKNARYYYETDAQGNKLLRHILIGSRDNVLQVPTDGNIGIDVLPPDSVGTDEIKDASIQMQDLSPEVKEAMGDHHTYDESNEQLTLG